MFVRCCIHLAQLILRIEGRTFDAEFCEELASRARRLPTATRCCTQTLKILQRKMTSDKPSCTQNRWHPISQSCAEVVIDSPYSTATHRPIPVADRAQVKAILTDVVDMVSAVDVGVGSGHFVATKAVLGIKGVYCT